MPNRPSLRKALPGVLVSVLLLGITVSLAYYYFPMNARTDDSTSSLPGNGFQRLRGPILGHAIEYDERSRNYRLVRVQSPEEVLFTGGLEGCETKLVEELENRYGTGNLNVPFPTIGGKQFWADLLLYAGWRIQENVYTGHCRLLDKDDIRRAWGSWESCRTALEVERQRRGLRPSSEHLVVLLHGLIRSKDSFGDLPLALEKAGYEVANVNYPSTRKSIDEHAAQIETILENSEGATKVSFVTHSLGGIVVRKLLARHGVWRDRVPVDRIVMIAPPSRGSIAAETLASWLPFEVVMGSSGQELTPAKVASIPKPDCEFAIIAGGRGDKEGRNPLLPGDDDGLVTVDNARLPGAHDFLVIDANHTFIMRKEATRDAVISFLRDGCLVAGRAPVPIPHSDDPLPPEANASPTEPSDPNDVR